MDTVLADEGNAEVMAVGIAREIGTIVALLVHPLTQNQAPSLQFLY